MNKNKGIDKFILVCYEVISGEWSAYSHRTFSLDGREDDDVIHEYFEEFWGEETEVDIYASRYNHDSWEQAVKISSVQYISAKEYAIMRKYGF